MICTKERYRFMWHSTTSQTTTSRYGMRHQSQQPKGYSASITVFDVRLMRSLIENSLYSTLGTSTSASIGRSIIKTTTPKVCRITTITTTTDYPLEIETPQKKIMNFIFILHQFVIINGTSSSSLLGTHEIVQHLMVESFVGNYHLNGNDFRNTVNQPASTQ